MQIFQHTMRTLWKPQERVLNAVYATVKCPKTREDVFQIAIYDLWFATVRVSSHPPSPATVFMRPNGA